MSGARSLFRGASVVFLGEGAGQFLGLLRNFAVARLVSPDNFGVAVTFVATLAVLEAMANLAWDKLLVQARNGEDPQLMAVIHLINLARGLLIGAALLLAAGPIARAFDVPTAEGAFACLALAPVLRGLQHMDVKRFQRGLRFGPDAGASLAAAAAGAVLAVGLALVLGDYWAMLWGVVGQSAVLMLASHLFAERPYRIAFDRRLLGQILIFGWPLLLNGLLLVATAQGDRLLVGAQLSVRDLALYGAAALLVEAPRLILSRAVGSIGLSWLAAVQADPAQLLRRYRLFAAASSLATVAVFVPVTLGAGEAVVLVYGADYRAPAMLAGWLAVGSALRFISAWAVAAALAVGDTKYILITNSVRPPGLLAVAAYLALGGDAIGVAAAMAGVEIASLAVVVLRLRRFETLGPHAMPPGVVAAVVALGATLLALAWAAPASLTTLAALAIGLTAAGLAAIVAVSPDFRAELLALRRSARSNRS